MDPALAQQLSRAHNFTYRSTFGDGQSHIVSGGLYEPKGAPPPGGWPVIAYAHGTSGIDGECAPTGRPDLIKNAPIIQKLVQQGWAVAATDYQGLGTPGPHRYLDSSTAGRNVLDAARAARNIDPALSDRVMLYGVSQGGQASQAAAELAPGYAPELTVQGNAMNSPALDVSPFVDAIDSKTLSPTQYGVQPYLLAGVEISDPNFHARDVLHGVTQQEIDILRSCDDKDTLGKGVVALRMNPSNAYFATADSRQRMTKFLSDNAFPQKPPRIPTFIARGTDDTLIRPAWTDAAVAKMRSLGIEVDEVFRPGDHGGEDDVAPTLEWLAHRVG